MGWKVLCADYKKEKNIHKEKGKPSCVSLNFPAPFSFLPSIEMLHIMEYKDSTRNISTCLECGDKIRYGRTDKKFCCRECKEKHFNRLAKDSRSVRRRIVSQLNRNYEILESLVRSGIDSVDVTDLISMGFQPGIVTSFRRVRSKTELSCFDIKYIMTPSRISGISKIQNVYVPLQVRTENTITIK